MDDDAHRDQRQAPGPVNVPGGQRLLSDASLLPKDCRNLLPVDYVISEAGEIY
jgi:hypothetical protein